MVKLGSNLNTKNLEIISVDSPQFQVSERDPSLGPELGEGDEEGEGRVLYPDDAHPLLRVGVLLVLLAEPPLHPPPVRLPSDRQPAYWVR